MPPMPPSQNGSSRPNGPIVPPPTPAERKEAKAVPFGTEPVQLASDPTILPRRSHRLRNFLLLTIFGGAFLFGGGVFGSLRNDTVYEIFTEYVPYGEEAVLFLQEREFRNRFPEAHRHISRGSKSRSTAANVYIPASGIEARVRDVEKPGSTTPATDPSTAGKVKSAADSATTTAPTAELLQPGPQTSAKADAHKSADTSAAHAGPVNQDVPKQAADSRSGVSSTVPAAATSAKTSTTASNSKTSATASNPKTSATTPAIVPAKDAPSGFEVFSPVHPSKIEKFDIADVRDKSIERLLFALNGVIATANEYGATAHFRDCIENAKDEVRAINSSIGGVQSKAEQAQRVRFDAQEKQLREDFAKQGAQLKQRTRQTEQHLAQQLEQARHQLEAQYQQRLASEVQRIDNIANQRLKNDLTEQAAQLHKLMQRDVRSQVEQERGGRLGRLEQLQKSVQELKQLQLDSSDYVKSRARVQDLEIAVAALKTALRESDGATPFVDELAALREVAGNDDELVRAAVSSISRDAFENGIPTLAQLSDRFRSVRDKVNQAALVPDDAGAGAHALSWLLSHAMFEKRGMVVGDDVAAILSRAQAYLEASDLDAAIREVNSLRGWPKVLAQDWLNKARSHAEVQLAVDALQTSAVYEALKLRLAEQRA
ncbi:MICOS complex subunit mic60 [Savitreella phatthalungensis]